MLFRKIYYPFIFSVLVSSCISIPGLSPNTSPSPSSSNSPNPSPSSTNSSNSQNNVLNDKESFIKFLRCALENSKSENDKLAINSLIQAINLIPDIAWVNAKGAYTSHYAMFEKYCTSISKNTNENTNSNKEFELSDTISEGIKKLSCSEEGNIKSANGKSINLEFINNTDKKLKIYWLNFFGKRMPYNKSFNSKSTYKQQTYITHPWLITDENDNCIQIYLPENESASKIEINSFSLKN